MILYLTHFRWNEGDQKTYGILSDVPISQIQNAGFLAQGTNLEDDATALPYIWNFLTGQLLSQAVSSIDVSRITVVSELELDVGNINAFYQYRATTGNEVYNLLLSNPDGSLNNPDDYAIINGMYHGKVGDISSSMFDGSTFERFKDIEGMPEDDPTSASLDMIALSAANEESVCSLKVKDKGGMWHIVKGISVKTHGGSGAATVKLDTKVPCLTANGDVVIMYDADGNILAHKSDIGNAAAITRFAMYEISNIYTGETCPFNTSDVNAEQVSSIYVDGEGYLAYNDADDTEGENPRQMLEWNSLNEAMIDFASIAGYPRYS